MNALICRIPGCGGHNHADDLCNSVARIDGPGIALIAEVEAWEGTSPELIVWEAEDIRNLFRTRDQAEAGAFADKLRALAAAVDKGAALLAVPPKGIAKPDLSIEDAALLFDLENENGDTDAPHAHIESLLIVLAEWRPRVVAMLAEAPEWAVPEAAAYRRALDRTREAYTQWSFQWEGGPALPYPFDLPEPVAAPLSGSANVARIVSAGRRDLVVRGVAA
jgi:hypothetical protein